ncbi:hypothetical protein BU24DRAFT_419647 [Aaosphaeria arxii CBS 175.79]|uniref:Calcium channel YVC1-like C-terminal transmembrane domain-containing protein n=1 Tax=Aaosphaeria arxii CBS 175.79 TaxID=1450172 RepID=A0A6A5Y4U5_9PLEO|nr:uncharacterized protein BU24DRAFT_419647 [Aaosphaeria arxii CBS 175.79]KAF2020057.1 hypothetical protein BU24DRAFT_419647 [Aaosphaeria arxii CBS 175.79]
MVSPPSTPRWAAVDHPDIPEIGDDDAFDELAMKLALYFNEAISLPHSFDDLRSLPYGRILSPLTVYLSDNVHHPGIVSALLALKGHFTALEENSDEPGLNEARGYACEFVAWQFLTSLSEREAIDFLLFDLAPEASNGEPDSESEVRTNGGQRTDAPGRATDRTPLLESQHVQGSSNSGGRDSSASTARSATAAPGFTAQFVNLSALEIAAVTGAKKFLSQRPVQKMINGLWRGDIVFWETLSVDSVKHPRFYTRRADIFCRLRVPRYLKVFETLFFTVFLFLFYVVLYHKSYWRVTPMEILLYIWIVGFAYDEFGEFSDAGQISFYASDFWWVWDISIVLVGTSFFVLRVVGLTMSSTVIIELAFDVLGLEALFLVPRIFSLLSLHPYFGTLIPCLTEMTKDFVKFLSLVIILYLGFLTTFISLARGLYTPRQMAWILVKVFFGSSYLGLEVAQEISPVFGPPVMLIFLVLTNFLLITSLISLLSNSLDKVLEHAREEYLFIYSVYVLEASTSNRLTYYLPPLNLIPLLLRPLRLVLPSERLRSARILLLKVSHLPFIAAIWVYEQLIERTRKRGTVSIKGPETLSRARGSLLLPANTRHANMGIHELSPGNSGSGGGRPGRSSSDNRPQTRTGRSATESHLEALVLQLVEEVKQLTTVVSQLQEREAGMAS